MPDPTAILFGFFGLLLGGGLGAAVVRALWRWRDQVLEAPPRFLSLTPSSPSLPSSTTISSASIPSSAPPGAPPGDSDGVPIPIREYPPLVSQMHAVPDLDEERQSATRTERPTLAPSLETVRMDQETGRKLIQQSRPPWRRG